MRFVRAILAVWLCFGLLPLGDLLSASQSEHICAHGHKNCQCPDQCGRPAPEPNEAVTGMACHRTAKPSSEKPVEGPCWRSCSSQDEAAQSAPRTFYLSAGDLVAAPAQHVQPDVVSQAKRLTGRPSLPPAPPPRNG